MQAEMISACTPLNYQLSTLDRYWIIKVGVARSAVVPSPSWPSLLAPQQNMPTISEPGLTATAQE